MADRFEVERARAEEIRKGDRVWCAFTGVFQTLAYRTLVDPKIAAPWVCASTASGSSMSWGAKEWVLRVVSSSTEPEAESRSMLRMKAHTTGTCPICSAPIPQITAKGLSVTVDDQAIEEAALKKAKLAEWELGVLRLHVTAEEITSEQQAAIEAERERAAQAELERREALAERVTMADRFEVAVVPADDIKIGDEIWEEGLGFQTVTEVITQYSNPNCEPFLIRCADAGERYDFDEPVCRRVVPSSTEPEEQAEPRERREWRVINQRGSRVRKFPSDGDTQRGALVLEAIGPAIGTSAILVERAEQVSSPSPPERLTVANYVADLERTTADAQAEMVAAEARETALREALEIAADDLDKAANQFAGLIPNGNNQHKFASKAARARAALSTTPEDSDD